MKRNLINIIFLIIPIVSNGQKILLGEVSYMSSNNIYVKFENTKEININDTLYSSNGAILTACLIVNNKSSISCVCTKIEDCQIDKGDKLSFITKILPKKTEKEPDKIKEARANPIITNVIDDEEIEEVIEEKKQRIDNIRGRLSASSYNNFLDGTKRGNMRYRFSMGARNISNSKFSADTYLTYRQSTFNSNSTTSSFDNIFRVYNLSLNYEFNEDLIVSIGRKINNRTSNLGAIDGLQVEKHFNKITLGAILGSRPDFSNYGINLNLLQYGAFIGINSEIGQPYHQTTVGFIQQKNNGKTDRMFSYLQHSNNYIKNLNIFCSMEIDVFDKINGIESNNISLTNLFISTRYRINRNISLSASFDTRKNIIYYETDKDYIERLLDDEARQGLRLMLNIRPIKNVSVGISNSKRFQNNNSNKSDNYNAYLTWSRVPFLKALISLRANYNESNYSKNLIYSGRLSKDFFKSKLNSEIYYRQSDYQYLSSEYKYVQYTYGVNLSWRIQRKLTLHCYGEYINSQSNSQYRINSKLIKRF